MSFRKRNDIINRPSQIAVPGRETGVNRGIGSRHGRVPTIDVPQRAPGRHMEPEVNRKITQLAAKIGVMDLSSPLINENHPGIRPSPSTSQQTTSTGCNDLDKLLGHMGLPLGNSLLIEEQTSTDFASILAKLFASQGIVHNRVDGSTAATKGNTHLVVLTTNTSYAAELPGVFKGSSKTVKKTKISEQESKITVQNLVGSIPSVHQPTRYQDLKIAWRYGLADEGAKKTSEISDSDTYPNYNSHFDITSRLVPAPSAAEVTYVSPLQSPITTLCQIETIIKNNRNKLVRILLPNMLHPALYPPNFSQLQVIIPLLHGIRALLKKYSANCVLLATISSELLMNHSNLLLMQIEAMFDSVINLEPFNQDMLQLLERAYKSQPNKVQHGLVHVYKLPVFSEAGGMHIMKSEWAFKNGKKKFEIEAWGIPVDDDNDHIDARNEPYKKAESKRQTPMGEQHAQQHSPELDF
ncbi:HDR098Cp [Eremothecium sinecaudum]|uniref:Elongator complex protein 4 n=1 Tax=Eremothecium sinecaudum TaxID=45286 RepID=A0A0X8HSX1_9SACH|nr:HDR098Cp [Eremothecium sinecaudum]AMD20840.1 HDR098Cp [Eremothecium sinecaudum]